MPEAGELEPWTLSPRQVKILGVSAQILFVGAAAFLVYSFVKSTGIGVAQGSD